MILCFFPLDVKKVVIKLNSKIKTLKALRANSIKKKKCPQISIFNVV